MSELDEMLAGLRGAVDGTRWPDAARVRARGDRRRTHRTMGLSAVLVLGLAVLVGGVAVARGTGHRAPQTPAVSPSGTAAAAPRIIQLGSVFHAVEPLSMAVGQGSVWLAFRAAPLARAGDQPGPGELVRLDAQTLRVTAHWPIVGSPVALAVTDHYVWVAGDVFDGRPPAQNANHVQQFDPTGRLVHTYAVTDPSAMAAQGDTVWVQSGTPADPAQLLHLHDGHTDAPLGLPGSNAGAALAACPDGLYALDPGASVVHVSRVVDGQVSEVDSLPGGAARLFCDPAGGALVVLPGSVTHFAGAGHPWGSGRPLPGDTVLGASTGRVWLAPTTAATRVWTADGDVAHPSASLDLPWTVTLATSADQTLWTVGADPTRPDIWFLAMLDPG